MRSEVLTVHTCDPWAVRPFAVEALGLCLGQPESCRLGLSGKPRRACPTGQSPSTPSGGRHQSWLLAGLTLGHHPENGATLWLWGVTVIDGKGVPQEMPWPGSDCTEAGPPLPELAACSLRAPFHNLRGPHYLSFVN